MTNEKRFEDIIKYVECYNHFLDESKDISEDNKLPLDATLLLDVVRCTNFTQSNELLFCENVMENCLYMLTEFSISTNNPLDYLIRDFLAMPRLMSNYVRNAFKYLGEEEFSQKNGEILVQLLVTGINFAAAEKVHDIYRRTIYLDKVCDSLGDILKSCKLDEQRQIICDVVFAYYLLSVRLYTMDFGVDMYDSIELFDHIVNHFDSIKLPKTIKS